MFAIEFTSSDGVFMFALMPILVCLLYSMSFSGLRFELTTPRDEPIRLNRNTGKIYVSDFAFSQNPFGKWNATVREFDWADVQCELIRYMQFNSRFFVMRYGLDLAICKPGTLEVVERIWLERNNSFPDLLRGKWQYLIAYMEGKPLAELPPTTLRSQTVSWRNSFDMWLPWVLDPKTYFGAHPLLLLLTIVMMPLAPFFLLAVIGNYVAMRLSPPAHWPQWVDEACGLRADQPGDRRGMLQ